MESDSVRTALVRTTIKIAHDIIFVFMGSSSCQGTLTVIGAEGALRVPPLPPCASNAA
jgi:hypothetical protein